MIQLRSRLKVADNSGAKDVACFKVLRGARAAEGQVGDTIMVSVKSAMPRGTVKKKEVLRAVVVRQTKPYCRADGTTIRFDENAAVILTDALNPRGTRILGPIARELREKGFTKIISLAPEVL